MNQRTVSARSLLITVLVVLVLGVVAVGAYVWRPSFSRSSEGELVSLSEDSTASVGYAGAFPADGSPLLPRPLGIDGDDDRLYVAFGDAAAIGVFDYEGARVGTVTVDPAPQMQTATPVDVAVLDDGRLAVVDTAASRVWLVDPDDAAADQETIGSAGKNAVSKPTAVDAAQGHVYIADAGSASVKEFTEDGGFVRELTFDAPVPAFIGGLCASGSTLWVSDSNADRVVALDLETGRQKAVLPGPLSLPRGIAIGPEGEVMVAETFARRISAFDSQGTSLVMSFPDDRTETTGDQPRLRAPESLYWSQPESRLYVTDAVEGRIEVFNLRASDEGSGD